MHRNTAPGTGRHAGSFRRENARIHSSFAGAIATTVLPHLALPPSWLHLEDAAACPGRAGVNASAPFQCWGTASIGEWKIPAQRQFCCVKGFNLAPKISTAGDAHVAADAGAVMPAVDDEVVALRLQPDGA